MSPSIAGRNSIMPNNIASWKTTWGRRSLAKCEPQRHGVEVEREAHEVTGAIHSGRPGVRNRSQAKK